MAGASPRKGHKPKRALPSVPGRDSPRLKSVTFNEETYETSIGGTESVGKIKPDAVLLHFDSPVTVESVSSKLANKNNSHASSKRMSKETNQPSVTGKENQQSSKDEIIPKSNSSGTKFQSSSKSSVPKESPKKSVKVSAPSSYNKNSSNGVSNPKLQLFNVFTSAAKNRSEKKSSAESDSGNSSDNDNNTKVDKKKTADSSIEASKKDEIIIPPPKFTEPFSKPITPNKVNKFVFNTPSSDDRRTTLEKIASVATSPFRAPSGKNSRRHTLESKIFATPDCYNEGGYGSSRRLLPIIQDESMMEHEEERGVCDGEDSVSITVAVRVRPFSQRYVNFFYFSIHYV